MMMKIKIKIEDPKVQKYLGIEKWTVKDLICKTQAEVTAIILIEEEGKFMGLREGIKIPQVHIMNKATNRTALSIMLTTRETQMITMKIMRNIIIEES